MQITAKKNEIIEIGCVGEHNANNVIVDVSEMNGDVFLAEFQNRKFEKFVSGFLEVSENNLVSIPITESVTRYAGKVYIQVVSTKTENDEVIIVDKSDRFECVVTESVEGSTEEWQDEVDGLIKDLNDLIDRINNLDDLVPDNGITSNKIADKAVEERHISEDLLNQIQSGGNAIKSHTEFPTDPKEGDTIILTERAKQPLKYYGYAKEDWQGVDADININVVPLDIPLALEIGIDFNKSPILEDCGENIYSLICFNKFTEDYSMMMYGYLEFVADKCFFLYENDHIKFVYISAGTTIFEGNSLINETGWYEVKQGEFNDDYFVPISEASEEIKQLSRVFDTSIYDTYFYDLVGLEYENPYSEITEEIFQKIAPTLYAVVNPSTYTFNGTRWIDIMHHGQTQRHIEKVTQKNNADIGTGHLWSRWKTELYPTCTETGFKQRNCLICDEFEIIEIPALGHDWVVTVVPPTHTEQGYTQHICLNDPEHNYNDDYVPALGHTWGDWVVVLPPTPTLTGLKERTCTLDGAVEQEVIPVFDIANSLTLVRCTLSMDERTVIVTSTAEIITTANFTIAAKEGNTLTVTQGDYITTASGGRYVFSSANAELTNDRFETTMVLNDYTYNIIWIFKRDW